MASSHVQRLQMVLGVLDVGVCSMIQKQLSNFSCFGSFMQGSIAIIVTHIGVGVVVKQNLDSSFSSVFYSSVESCAACATPRAKNDRGYGLLLLSCSDLQHIPVAVLVPLQEAPCACLFWQLE